MNVSANTDLITFVVRVCRPLLCSPCGVGVDDIFDVSFFAGVSLFIIEHSLIILLIRLRVFRDTSTESLILAQDERWRRA